MSWFVEQPFWLQLALPAAVVSGLLLLLITWLQTIKVVRVQTPDRTSDRVLIKGDIVWLRGPVGSMTDSVAEARKRTCRIHSITDGRVNVWMDEVDPDSPSLVAIVLIDIDPADLSTEPV